MLAYNLQVWSLRNTGHRSLINRKSAERHYNQIVGKMSELEATPSSHAQRHELKSNEANWNSDCRFKMVCTQCINQAPLKTNTAQHVSTLSVTMQSD